MRKSRENEEKMRTGGVERRKEYKNTRIRKEQKVRRQEEKNK